MQQHRDEFLINKQEVVLPEEIQHKLEEFMDSVVEIEKEDYHNDIIPFPQHEKSMRAKAKESVHELLNQYNHGQKLLKEILEKEELNNKTLPPEACFARWEEAFLLLNEKMSDPKFGEELYTKSVQELAGIDWQLMDRAFAAAKKLAEEMRFEDALAVFTCLRNMNPEVLEYWLGEAACLYELGEFEEALELYSMSLVLQPQNPSNFFQIANCLYKMQELASCLEALNLCIKYAQGDRNYDDLLKNALEIKHGLENQKVA
jgi:tetratricopeptide (TPR) repeat protein